ncbi:ABC transporter permease [Candidatus Bathyarchaeota archaeon]|nr:ABC transporter permease [Candidatus Bathyarchaeota archaeon]
MSKIIKIGATIKKYLRYNYKLKIGFALIVTLVFLALIETPINYVRFGESDPLRTGAFGRYLPPSIKHPLGTDLVGRDMLSMILEGLKNSLILGVEVGTISMIIGTVVAIISGYKGGLYDTILRTLTDSILVLPSWLIFVILTLYMRLESIHSFSLILAIFNWPWVARTIRAQTLAIKKLPYIDLAKMSGLRDLEIIFREILPNLLPYVIVGFANALMGAILAESGVRMIGLGPSTLITLGLIIYWSMNWGVLSLKMYHIIVPPILLLVTIFASLNLLNIGLEEQFNPRIKKITGL